MIIGISDIEKFRVFFDVVLEYRDTVELFANEIGVKISLLDRSHSCFCEVFYEKEFFDEYDVDGSEVISLHIEEFYKILKTADKKEKMILSNDESLVHLVFQEGENVRMFELVQAADYDETPQLPSIDLDCSFIVEMDALAKTFKDVDLIKTNGINVVVKGDDLILSTTETAQTRYSHTIFVVAKGESSNRYSVKYLKDIIKFRKISDDVSVEFGEDKYPFVWSCESNHMAIKGLIAPLIEVEE